MRNSRLITVLLICVMIAAAVACAFGVFSQAGPGALLWLGVIVPPLLSRSIYPEGVEHYTTMIVQGLDPGLLLGPGYLVFLSILMTALVAKIIPVITGASILCALLILRALRACPTPDSWNSIGAFCHAEPLVVLW